MRFEVMFNHSIKNENEILKQLGCELSFETEEGAWIKNIESLEELNQLQGAVQVLTNDDSYNLLIDFDGIGRIYFDNKS